MGLEEHYRSLGLKPGASREQIKSAYRKLARQFHPDTGTPFRPTQGQSHDQTYNRPLDETQDQPQGRSQPLDSTRSMGNPPKTDDFLRITTAYKHLLQQLPLDRVARETPAKQAIFHRSEDPVKYQAYQRLRLLFTQQRFANAIALVEALTDRLPQDPEVQQWRAIAYQQQGRRLIQERQFSQAVRYLQKALHINPTNRTLVATLHQDLRGVHQQIKQAQAQAQAQNQSKNQSKPLQRRGIDPSNRPPL